MESESIIENCSEVNLGAWLWNEDGIIVKFEKLVRNWSGIRFKFIKILCSQKSESKFWWRWTTGLYYIIVKCYPQYAEHSVYMSSCQNSFEVFLCLLNIEILYDENQRIKSFLKFLFHIFITTIWTAIISFNSKQHIFQRDS